MWIAASLAGEGRLAVVTFDNGEFNAPLYSPRWNGRWRQPSVAQELATAVARVHGNNPMVFSYMPAGRTEGLPGELHAVRPQRPACEGPSEEPSDKCWCSPADNCWNALQANYHPSGSTSLARTASSVRAAVGSPGRPRIEVHFTDFFEEDPGTAEDPADSDRCVTADGMRRAMGSLLTVGEGESLDHLVVGLLRRSIDPPPPGGGWGTTYRFEPAKEGGGCWSGVVGRTWDHRSAPLDFVVGVVLIGVNTADDAEGTGAFVESLADQLSAEGSQLDLVTLIEPQVPRVVDAVVAAVDADPWRLGPHRRPSRMPCTDVQARAELSSGFGRLEVVDAQGRCDGQVGVTFASGELGRHFTHVAGIDPREHDLTVSGRVVLRSDPGAIATVLGAFDASGERGLPLWPSVVAALDPRRSPDSPVQAWSEELEIRALRISDLDRRPWLLAVVAATALALAAGISVGIGLRQLHAARAMRERYEASGAHPEAQRPLAVILAEAQQEVARGWMLRSAIGAMVSAGVMVIAFWTIMAMHRAMNG